MILTAAPVQQGDPAECLGFGEGVAGKLIAFYGQGGLLARTPVTGRLPGKYLKVKFCLTLLRHLLLCTR